MTPSVAVMSICVAAPLKLILDLVDHLTKQWDITNRHDNLLFPWLSCCGELSNDQHRQLRVG